MGNVRIDCYQQGHGVYVLSLDTLSINRRGQNRIEQQNHCSSTSLPVMSRNFCCDKGLVVAVSALFSLLLASTNGEKVLVPSLSSDDGFEEVSTEDVVEFTPFFVPETDIIFELFTQNNPNESQILSMSDPDSITGSYFDKNHPTRFTIHGWTGDGESSMNAYIRDAYMELGEFNVIYVDWGAAAQTPNYIAARNRVGPTGTQVGAFIQYLSEVTGASTREMTVIGYSLGAHVAGFAGKALSGPFRLGAIVALDAARPLFSFDRPDQRLDVRDAEYVESYHTNVGTLGFDLPLGHASFYPNFGRRQPGCGVDPAGGCAHARSHRLFTEALNSETGFYARQCRSVNDVNRGSCIQAGPDMRMGGEPTDTGARGVYWLPTNSRAPFAKGESWLDQRMWSRQRWLLIVSLCVGIPVLIVILIICYYTEDKRLRTFRCSQWRPCGKGKKKREGLVYNAGSPRS